MAEKAQDYEQKATTDTSFVADQVPQDVWMDMVNTASRANLVMRPLAARVDRRLVGSPGDTVKIEERGTLSVNTESEGGTTTAQTVSDGNITVTVPTDVKETKVEITDEADEDSRRDEFQTYATEAGEAHAEKRDSEAYSTVTSLTAGGSDPAASEAFSSDLSTAGEIDYSQSQQLAAQMAQGASSTSGDGWSPTDMVISHLHLADLRDEDKFILANEAGTTEGLREGRVGRFTQMDVHVTRQANAPTTNSGDVQAVLLNRNRAFVEVIKREIETEQDRKTESGKTIVVDRARYTHNVVEEHAIGYLKNA